MTGDDLIRALAEPERLSVFGAVAVGATTPTDIAELAGTTSRVTARALHQLTAFGVVNTTSGSYEIDVDALREAARESAASTAVPSPEGPLAPFIRDGTLSRLPAQWERKKAVLEHVATHAFDLDVAYSEPEVNAILTAWCEGGITDHVTLRRYLVDLHFLTRSDGVYRADPTYRGDYSSRAAESRPGSGSG